MVMSQRSRGRRRPPLTSKVIKVDPDLNSNFFGIRGATSDPDPKDVIPLQSLLTMRGCHPVLLAPYPRPIYSIEKEGGKYITLSKRIRRKVSRLKDARPATKLAWSIVPPID